jgi:endo-1,4-beta-xylanase
MKRAIKRGRCFPILLFFVFSLQPVNARSPNNVSGMSSNPPQETGVDKVGGVGIERQNKSMMTNLPVPIEVPLWKEGVPGVVPGSGPGSDDGTGRWRDVGIPSLLVYLPDIPAPASGRIALIVCPGGGYTHLTRLVGADGVAASCLPLNIAVIALKYRISPPSPNVEKDALEDGKRAVRLVRTRAKEWGIDPTRIGMLGWSAGANLSLNTATHSDGGNSPAPDPVEGFSCRPDFMALLSPWPGRPPHPLADYPMDHGAPPVFIASARDDRTAPVTFAEEIAAACERSGVIHSLWTPETGGHNAFMIGASGEGGQWVGRFISWIKEIGVWK